MGRDASLYNTITFDTLPSSPTAGCRGFVTAGGCYVRRTESPSASFGDGQTVIEAPTELSNSPPPQPALE